MSDHPIDRINAAAIAVCPVIEDRATGRRRYLMGGGGHFSRAITGWVFTVNDQTVTVSVPSTIAALETRDANLNRVDAIARFAAGAEVTA